MKKLISLILASGMLLSLCSCNKDEEVTFKNRTRHSSINIENSMLDEVISQVISGQSTGAGTTYFEKDGVLLEFVDRHESIEIVDKYVCDNAIYFKVMDTVEKDYYLYRFQISDNGLIESYICYVLEA